MSDETPDAVRDAVREGYYRILLGQGKTAARQFAIDWLLAEPGPFLEWMDANAAFAGASIGLPGWVFERYFHDRAGLASEDVDGIAAAVDGGGGDIKHPNWVNRFNGFKMAVVREMAFAAPSSPQRGTVSAGGLGDSLMLAVHLSSSHAPMEDYQLRQSPAVVAEFVFRGGAFAPAAEGSRAVAHGVWLGRGHTWCETPVTADDSRPVYSRTARGFLRLPSRCPECERFLRGMIESEGGAVRSFVLLQRLDTPETLPPAVLALLDDPGVQFGDEPLPEDTGDEAGG